MIKESEVKMLEWSAEKATEIKTTANRSGILADCDECGTRSSKPGVRVAADAYSIHGSHEL